MTIKGKEVISGIVLKENPEITHSACRDKEGNIYIPMHIGEINSEGGLLIYLKVNRFEDLPIIDTEGGGR